MLVFPLEAVKQKGAALSTIFGGKLETGLAVVLIATG
jgi:hypothetical protein